MCAEVNVRNVIDGIKNVLHSNTIFAWDVEIGKLYFTDQIQLTNSVCGCFLNNTSMLSSLLIMLEHTMHILYTIIYLCRVLLQK